MADVGAEVVGVQSAQDVGTQGVSDLLREPVLLQGHGQRVRVDVNARVSRRARGCLSLLGRFIRNGLTVTLRVQGAQLERRATRGGLRCWGTRGQPTPAHAKRRFIDLVVSSSYSS